MQSFARSLVLPLLVLTACGRTGLDDGQPLYPDDLAGPGDAGAPDLSVPRPDGGPIVFDFAQPVDLSRADLTRPPTDFSGVDLTGVDLTSPPVDLSQPPPQDFSQPPQDLSRADLSGADLSRVDLSQPPTDGGPVDLSRPVDLSPGLCVGKVCDDGNPCTDDFCNPLTGQCGTRPHSCDDNDACTFDGCFRQAGGCVHVPLPNNFPCNDGNACTTNDRCQNRVCVGQARNCNDNNSCTTDRCDVASGTCVHTPGPSGALCDDNNPCTSSDVCTGGVCVGTAVANGASCIVGAGAGCCSAGNCCLGGGCVCM